MACLATTSAWLSSSEERVCIVLEVRQSLSLLGSAVSLASLSLGWNMRQFGGHRGCWFQTQARLVDAAQEPLILLHNGLGLVIVQDRSRRRHC